jgi:hypothetical protein
MSKERLWHSDRKVRVRKDRTDTRSRKIITDITAHRKSNITRDQCTTLQRQHSISKKLFFRGVCCWSNPFCALSNTAAGEADWVLPSPVLALRADSVPPRVSEGVWTAFAVLAYRFCGALRAEARLDGVGAGTPTCAAVEPWAPGVPGVPGSSRACLEPCRTSAGDGATGDASCCWDALRWVSLRGAGGC